MSPKQPIKLSDLDKSHIEREGLLNKYLCKKSNISNETAEIAIFHIFHCKSMENMSCHSNHSRKTQLFVPRDVICVIWKESAPRLQRRSCLKLLTDRSLIVSDS